MLIIGNDGDEAPRGEAKRGEADCATESFAAHHKALHKRID